jgi:L-rhamnose-H+ transport protein
MQTDPQFSGWLYVLVAGICQGSFMVPMKWAKGWAWENSWLIFATTAYLICPWLFVLLTVPEAVSTYAAVSSGRIAAVIGMGLLWGLGALSFGLGVNAVGLSIGFAVIIGVATCSGTLVPLLLFSTQLDPTGIAVTVVSLAVMLTGVVFCSLAGRWKESDAGTERSSYKIGILICIASGLLSSAGNLGFVLGQPIIEEARQRGADPDFASNLVWALLTISLFLCNSIYAVYRLFKKGTLEQFRQHRPLLNLACGIAMGALWMLGFAFYGAGTSRLGALGPSYGWAAMMSIVVFTANLSGIYTGEWEGAQRSSLHRLWVGMGLLLAAIIGLGTANWLG